MKKAFVFNIDEVNSLILSNTDASIEIDVDGWFYVCSDEVGDFDDKDCFEILSKELKAEVEDIVVDTTTGKVAVICK